MGQEDKIAKPALPVEIAVAGGAERAEDEIERAPEQQGEPDYAQ